MENLVVQRLEAVFKDKKVFITGHTGFKGSWLAACLHLFGARIKGYALAPEYKNGLFELLHPLGFVSSIIADIRTKDRLQEELLEFEPDFIFHLAAQPLVRRSYEMPSHTFEVNVAGTSNLLEAAGRLNGKCTIVVITTDKVYENKELDVLYTEDDVLGGYDPYSASKACAELVVSSFRRSFFNPVSHALHQKGVATARAGNVIGGGDWSEGRIVPDIIRSLMLEKQIDLRNPKAVRPWQHVLEPVTGYLLLAALLHEQPLQFGKAFNFGPMPGDHLTVRELVELSIKRWGKGSWNDVSSPAQPHEAGILKLDIQRASSELNWHPKLKAAQAIEWTIDWYKQPPGLQTEFTFKQINDYLSL